MGYSYCVLRRDELKNREVAELPDICDSIRAELISIIAKTGGHLGANLGVVELTVALHYVFDTPKDKFIWDVGHQAYVHKILTGRADELKTIRQQGGVSGFTKRSESEHDCFGAGHSSTSISAGLGMATANLLQGDLESRVISIIGDGAMSAGLAYEAMNNAGHIKNNRLIVVLNDNDMSIAPPTGAMSNYLSKLISSSSLHNWRQQLANLAPKSWRHNLRKAESYAKNMLFAGDNSTMFEQLGFYYVGPVDGHNSCLLVDVFQNIKNSDYHGPILVHIVTEKGKGYQPAEQAKDRFHGVANFDINTGKKIPSVNAPKGKTYTQVFSDALVAVASDDDKIIAITAAMPDGTGLVEFSQKFPERFFDVGIAEQHAVTFAAGLACEGYKPVCAIYSTFLQRAYDQVVHDVAIQNLPVIFAIDRAGLVGADGATHAGSFDNTYLVTLPNLTIVLPSSAKSLQNTITFASNYNDGPIAFRYPRGDCFDAETQSRYQVPTEVNYGKSNIVIQGSAKGNQHKVCLISCGHTLQVVLEVATELEVEYGLEVTIIDAVFLKPLDRQMLDFVATNYNNIYIVEEASFGGYCAIALEYLNSKGYITKYSLNVSLHYLPDMFIDHASQAQQRATAKLDKDSIIEKIKQLIVA